MPPKIVTVFNGSLGYLLIEMLHGIYCCSKNRLQPWELFALFFERCFISIKERFKIIDNNLKSIGSISKQYLWESSQTK